MVVTLLGMVMEVKLVQPWNALSPMLVTLLGMVMEVKLRQPLKAPLPIHFVPSLMVYVDKVLSTASTK